MKSTTQKSKAVTKRPDSKRPLRFMISLGTLAKVRITVTKPKLTKKARKRRATWRKSMALIMIGAMGGIYFSGQVFAAFTPAPIVKPSIAKEVKKASSAISLPASAPTGLQIDAAGINSPLRSVNLDATGAITVPDEANMAGWYSASHTPGEIGPAIIVGHLDHNSQPAVFWRLGELKPGANIAVKRQDGSTALFAVTEIGQYNSTNYPVDKIYGSTTTSELRIITCGGNLNLFTGHYEANTVVFATLTK